MRRVLLTAMLATGLTGLAAGSAMAQAGGSYLRTCTDVEQRGPYLTANCRDVRGNYRPTQIDTRSCGRFGNSNGRLICEGGRGRGDDGGGYGGGGGGYGGGGGNGYGGGGGGYGRPDGYAPPPRY